MPLTTLDIRVADADWFGTYDRLEVWRSVDLEAGPYEELTANGYKSARVPADGGDEPATPQTGPSANVVGLELELLVTTRALTITFTGSNPLTYADVADQIESGSLGLLESWVVDGGIVIETVNVGLATILTITGGAAAALLSLPTELPTSSSTGREARLGLAQGTFVYTFVDPNGASSYFYKARFWNSQTDTVSEFSESFQGGSSAAIDSTYLVRGSVNLVDVQGQPLVNREILVKSGFTGALIGTKNVAPTTTSKLTDENGHAEFLFVKGLSVTVAIAGTQVVRDLIVPDVDFNLLSPDVGTDDVFKVQVPELDYAVRRSL